jgi:ribosomal protein S27AE
MTPHGAFVMTPYGAAPMRFLHERYLGRPSCPKCGGSMMAPEHSEWRDEAIRHFWICDGCDYKFESLMTFGVAGAVGHLSP